MCRLPRMLEPGLPAHVVHRGNDRMRIFHGDGDFLFFIHCLREARRIAAVDIHSYVLMPNHVHLLLTPGEPEGISRFVQSVAGRYAAYFNRHRGRTGTLWEGRFHSTAILADRYLMACHRYIDLNPVRAGLARSPLDYLWSSHRHYAAGQPDSLVVTHALVETLRGQGDGLPRAYRGLFDTATDDRDFQEIREATQAGRVLGAALRPPRRGRPRKNGV